MLVILKPWTLTILPSSLCGILLTVLPQLSMTGSSTKTLIRRDHTYHRSKNPRTQSLLSLHVTSPLPQARQHLTKILRYPAIKGQQLPTFSQFLSYVAGDAASDNSEQGDA